MSPFVTKTNRIILGDALEVLRTLPDKIFDMVLCDLPYGITRNKWDSVIPLESLWEEYHRLTKPNAAIVLTAVAPFSAMLISSNHDEFRYEWIWEKPQGTGFLNAKIQPLRNHEQVLVFYREQPVYNPQFGRGGTRHHKSVSSDHTSSNYGAQRRYRSCNNGKRYPVTVLRFDWDREKFHPTQKPVALFEYLVKTYTNGGALVLDNCIGSGTTAIACRNTGRNFLGIEKNPEYVAVANDRLRRICETKTETLDSFAVLSRRPPK